MVNTILETIAVLTAVTYLILAAKEDVRCWYAAGISSLLYIYIMYQADLIMESILQIFYVLMAVYGWLQWKNIINSDVSLSIKRWSKVKHFYSISSVIILSIFTGIVLSNNTNAALPFLDAFTTWGAIISTYMVTKKIIENWIYWFVIDSVSIYLFISRELYLTAILFFIYLIIIIFGYVSWKNKLANNNE